MLRVDTPADDLQLLTTEELAAAVGLDPDDDSEDATLAAIGLRAAAAIAKHCRIAPGGTFPPTLRLEGLTETLLPQTRRRSSALLLARRPIEAPETIAVIEAGRTLAGTEFLVNDADGILVRVSSGNPIDWSCGQITVSYSAGWSTVPDDVKEAAAKLTAAYYGQSSDGAAGARSEEVPDVYRVTHMSPSDRLAPNSPLPAEVAALLEPYRNLY